MIRADLVAPIGELIGRQVRDHPEAVAFVDKITDMASPKRPPWWH
jgi:hypothetical protein